MRNGATQNQSTKRVAHQDTMMNLLAWFSRGQCQFINGSQAAVLRSYLITGGLAVPKGQQIQPREGKIFATPTDVHADDINFRLGHLGKTRDHVNKVFKSTNIPGVRIVHPAMDINEKKGTLCLAN